MPRDAGRGCFDELSSTRSTTGAPHRLVDRCLRCSGRSAGSFRLKTTAPISAYSIYPFGGITTFVPTATLLLPVTSLGSEYVVVNPAPQSLSVGSNPFTQLVATADDTVATLIASANITSAAGLPFGTAGVPYTVTMNRGEVVQFVQPAELTGSPLTSNKPLALLGGLTVWGWGPYASYGYPAGSGTRHIYTP